MTEAERSLLLAVAGTLRDRLYQGAHYDSAAGSHALSVALTELRDEAPADPARVQAQLDALATAIDRILTKLLAHVPTLVSVSVRQQIERFMANPERCMPHEELGFTLSSVGEPKI